MPSEQSIIAMKGKEVWIQLHESFESFGRRKPEQRGAIDTGHKNSQEVFYCCRGHVLLFDEQNYHELFGGDAIFIPEGLPHTLINIGEETAILIWAGAPGE